MRVDARTIAADKLQEFISTLGFPVLANLRDTQNYVHLAARGAPVSSYEFVESLKNT